jgi:hypothetical protein
MLPSRLWILAGLLLAIPCFAQTNNRFIFKVGGGFTEPVGPAARRFDTGFNITAGGGVNLSSWLGGIAEFGFIGNGLSQGSLDEAGVPDGSMRIYSVTLNPIIRFNPHGRFDMYLIGGGGYYRRTIEFTEPSVSVVTAFDPFWGVFFPAAIPTNVVLGSFTQNKGGVNGGAGFSIRLRGDSNAKLFAETRYHYIFTNPTGTSVLPVTFGFQW